MCVCVRHITVDDGLWCDAVYHVLTLAHVRRCASRRCGLTELFKLKPNSALICARIRLSQRQRAHQQGGRRALMGTDERTCTARTGTIVICTELARSSNRVAVARIRGRLRTIATCQVASVQTIYVCKMLVTAKCCHREMCAQSARTQIAFHFGSGRMHPRVNAPFLHHLPSSVKVGCARIESLPLCATAHKMRESPRASVCGWHAIVMIMTS